MTVDLDVLVRTALLEFLLQETTERKATVIYATHIYDGMDNWPTHVVHMRLGEIMASIPWPIPHTTTARDLPGDIHPDIWAKMQDDQRSGSKLMVLALSWLADDKKFRKQLEAEGKERPRGPNTADTNKDSFYKQYVVHHEHL